MKQLQVQLVSLLLIFLIACGGSSKSKNTNVTITLTPTTASVPTTQNQQFTAAVTGGSTSAVVWEVNGIAGGNTTLGFINTGGLYTAPTAVPNPASVTITAVAAADTTKTATATVTVTQSANLAISPSSLTMDAGATQLFTVTSNGSAVTGIVFSLSCHSTVGGACGSITSDGNYTAPLTVPPGNVILTAALTQASVTYQTSATITIKTSTQSTAGQYAFTLSGTDNGSSYHAAGSIAFDGNGNITGGSEDVNKQGTVSTANITGGTYTFSATDNRVKANVQTDQGNVTWYLSLVNRTHGYISYTGTGISASGTATLQDTTQFNLAALNGNYAFSVAGMNSSPTMQLAEIGAFTADGTGNLSSGLLDANSGGSLSNNQSLTGTATTPSSTTGRGTITVNSTFGAQTFAYYVVDATQVKLVETDASHSTAGDAFRQANGPYATTDFHGSFATILSGRSANGALGIGGTISLGAGNVSGGSLDRNDAGTFSGAQAVSAGNYSVADATTGRTTGSITYGTRTIPMVMYPLSDSKFYVLGLDATEQVSGVAVIGTGGNGSNSTLTGKYALGLAGAVGSIPEDVTGTLAANGGGVFTGTLDISNGGANTALQSSPYAVSATSTAVLKSGFPNFNAVGFNMYIIDSTQVFFLENDNKGVLTGAMDLQH